MNYQVKCLKLTILLWLSSLNKAMEDMLVAKAESYISTYYKKFKRTLPSKSDQENVQTIVWHHTRSWDDTIVYSIDFVCFIYFLYQQLQNFFLKINFIDVIVCRCDRDLLMSELPLVTKHGGQCCVPYVSASLGYHILWTDESSWSSTPDVPWPLLLHLPAWLLLHLWHHHHLLGRRTQLWQRGSCTCQ